MLSFFSKKNYLVDELEGFVDIHNHILPGIDDGAKTLEDSIAMIKGFSEFGISEFIATPHIMHNYYDNTPASIKGALNRLREEVSQSELNSVVISASAEHMIDGNFESILEEAAIMPLGGEHLLVEMSYLQPPINFEQAIKAVKHKWLYPVLAHPERYGFLHHRPRKYAEFKNENILFQLNLLSLSDYYGKDVSKMSMKLLEEGLIDFVGSDVHNTDQLTALKKITLSKKMLKLVKSSIDKTIQTFKS